MRILMMTNTYAPIVGGLEKSIQSFSEALRKRGHQVKIAAPEFDKSPAHEKNVIRIPAIQNISGTNFSLSLPAPGSITKLFEETKVGTVDEIVSYYTQNADKVRGEFVVTVARN